MRARLAAAAAVVLATAAVGCGGDDETSTTSTRAESTTTTQPQPAPVPAERTGPKRVDLYFTAGEQFERVPRELRGRGSELERTTEALLRGPRAADGGADVALRSQIPKDVRLERVSRDGGTVTVELSGEFDDGLGSAAAKRSPDQTAELAARVGQLTYTLTQLEGVDALAFGFAGDEAS